MKSRDLVVALLLVLSSGLLGAEECPAGAEVRAEKKFVLDWLSQPAIVKEFGEISEAIWRFAELGLQEFKSSALLVKTLEKEGFHVDTGLAGMPTEKLSIKVEIDTNPPNGARTEKHVVTRYVTFLLHHHDLPSLMARKIAAVLTRKYTKGRDWYDLVWYLSHRPPVAPNLELLGSALEQARGRGHDDAADWPSLVRERLAALDMDAVARDVRPFLERPEEARLLTRDNLARLLQG